MSYSPRLNHETYNSRSQKSRAFTTELSLNEKLKMAFEIDSVVRGYHVYDV